MVITTKKITKRISLDEIMKAFGISGDVITFDVPKRCNNKHLLIITNIIEEDS